MRCLVALLVAFGSVVGPRAAAQDVATRGHLLATAGIAGRFATASCEDGALLSPHETARFTGPLVEAATAHEPTLVLDTGGLLAPHGVVRFASAERPELVVELVAALGYDALAFGLRDLAAPRERTVRVASALRERGIPFVLSNLRCETASAALCDAVIDGDDDAPILSAGPTRTAVLAMLDPGALDEVAPDRAAGVVLAPLADALPAAVRRARAAGAELVVAVLDLRVEEALSLASELPPDGRPDAVLLSRAGEDLVFAEPASRTPVIVAPPPGSGVHVRILPGDDGERFVLRTSPLSSGGAHHPSVTAFADAIGPAFCEAWGRPLGGGLLARDLPADDVAPLLAAIVREHAGADVALLNRGATDLEFREVAGERLTNGDLYVAIEFDEPIVVADVPASWLFAAQERLAAHRLVAAGLSSTVPEGAAPTEGAMRIRGRPAAPRVRYRVATIRFLAEGGDDALPPLPDGIEWQTLEHAGEDGTVRYDALREVALAALDRADARDPRDARAPPEDAPEWLVRGEIDGEFSGSTVENDAGYTAAPLAIGSAMAMGVEVDVHVDARAPHWSWESQIFGRYRTQWAPIASGGSGEFVEAADQLQLRTLASYRGFRGLEGPVYIPDVYVEAFLESELSQPGDRDYHWLLARPTIGLRFPLASELDVKLQVGLQSQLLDPTAEAEVGAGASILLRPWVAISGDGRSITIDGLLDFFDADIFEENRWQLRGQLQVVLDLAGPLALTFGTNLYLQAEGDQEVAMALAATVGFRLSAVGRTVGP